MALSLSVVDFLRAEWETKNLKIALDQPAADALKSCTSHCSKVAVRLDTGSAKVKSTPDKYTRQQLLALQKRYPNYFQKVFSTVLDTESEKEEPPYIETLKAAVQKTAQIIDRQVKAATKIQSVFRGYSVRKKLPLKRTLPPAK